METEQQIARVAALHEPVRRDLYRLVVERGGEVSRESAARTLGISRSLAAFHLDRLVEEGLLEASFQRLTGRTGPGAGRPSKLYRRSGRDVTVSLPPRSYELAARLLVRAVRGATSPEAAASLEHVAHDFGLELGREARCEAGDQAPPEAISRAAITVLAAYGFEPRAEDGEIRLHNCPFHALVSEDPPLVCGMNLSLMKGVVEGLDGSGIGAVLAPAPGYCCVALCRVADGSD